ncbi:hypothetical protein VOI54_03525 [Tamlana sp. 2201CG12-4]|uniref:hypothetical protein n=1 Tax=Tamlana sp. 2201CG12-4 TaxID=3112582 RepID=UPI002DB81FE1|nr:hypothetical protein [Tamlana sp. 2201CG12-4]MEC3906072.1 hypothetical protein [Tamlana sp. 2201CG12-4]
MKKILTVIILSFIFQYSFAQSCETFGIKCTGKINSKSLIIQKIKLPAINFLLGKEGINLKNRFVEVKPNDNKFDVILGIEYGSRSIKPKKLLDFIKTKRDFIPIIISAVKNGENKDIEIILTWENVEMNKLENNFSGLFELNLNEINVE